MQSVAQLQKVLAGTHTMKNTQKSQNRTHIYDILSCGKVQEGIPH